MVIPAPQNAVEKMLEKALNPSANHTPAPTSQKAASTSDPTAIAQDKAENLNPNRSNDGNSGSPPTAVEKETGQFRGGVAEANSAMMPEDQAHKKPDD